VPIARGRPGRGGGAHKPETELSWRLDRTKVFLPSRVRNLFVLSREWIKPKRHPGVRSPSTALRARGYRRTHHVQTPHGVVLREARYLVRRRLAEARRKKDETGGRSQSRGRRRFALGRLERGGGRRRTCCCGAATPSWRCCWRPWWWSRRRPWPRRARRRRERPS